MEVAGMCWWGESALVVASRLKHGFILLLYSRKHLSSEALMIPPIKLPVGMRPLFMQVRGTVWGPELLLVVPPLNTRVCFLWYSLTQSLAFLSSTMTAIAVGLRLPSLIIIRWTTGTCSSVHPKRHPEVGETVFAQQQAVQEGGSRPGTDVLFLLVAGSTSYLLYRFR